MSHGLWHSYLFVLTIYPVLVSLIVYLTERGFEKTIFSVYRFLRFFPKKVRYSFGMIYFSSLIGGVSHIFFDMWVHENSSYVLFPLHEGNPFWVGEWSIVIFVSVGLLSLYAIFLWRRQMQIYQNVRAQTPITPNMNRTRTEQFPGSSCNLQRRFMREQPFSEDCTCRRSVGFLGPDDNSHSVEVL